MPFRYFVFSPGVMARHKDEITPSEIMKDEITPGSDEKTKCATRNDEKQARKEEKALCEIMPF